jgi:hypothetical protein
MYSDSTAQIAIALLRLVMHDTPMSETHGDLALQIEGLLKQADADEAALEAHMDATEPKTTMEFDTILVDNDKTPSDPLPISAHTPITIATEPKSD